MPGRRAEEAPEQRLKVLHNVKFEGPAEMSRRVACPEGQLRAWSRRWRLRMSIFFFFYQTSLQCFRMPSLPGFESSDRQLRNVSWCSRLRSRRYVFDARLEHGTPPSQDSNRAGLRLGKRLCNGLASASATTGHHDIFSRSRELRALWVR